MGGTVRWAETDDRMSSESPTKSAAGAGQRGQRQALGEIMVGGQDGGVWSAKRHRAA
jgi:hypothetical protein